MTKQDEQKMPMRMTFADFERRARKDREQTFKIEDLIIRQAAIQRIDPAVRFLIQQVLAKPRKNQKDLTQSEKDAFNSAIRAAEADGSYTRIATIHSDMSHRMHSIMGGGFIGGMRFLPWHRVYVSVLEQQLTMYHPDIRVPYWDWANDHALPAWVYLPPGITRGPDNSYTLPTQADIDNDVLNRANGADYVGMTYMFANPPGLEAYHNTVHDWVGGNTMPNPMTSPNDPLFWLHHANVDRIWAQWQAKNPSVLPPLAGPDATMDPWSWLTTNDANDTYNFSYYYA